MRIAYETWGRLAPDGSNAVLVLHALTGDSHVAGPAAPGHPTAGWWDALIGPGRALDTDRWFVVSDWSGAGPQAPGQRPVRSGRIKECEWVAMVEEEFEESVWKVHYSDLFRPVLHGTALPPQNPTLQSDLRSAHSKTRGGSQSVVRIEA